MDQFFDLVVAFVVKYWIFFAVGLAYGALSLKTVFRFWSEVFMQSPVYKAMDYWLIDRWDADPLRIIGTVISLVWVIPAFLLLFPIAPILWIILGVLDAKKWRAELECWRKYEEDRRNRDQLLFQKNRKRRDACEAWLKENRGNLTVYYNTIGGVTAVLTPADYELAQVETARKRVNGFWSKENLLILSPKTVVFATVQGKALISDFLLGDKNFDSCWRAELDDLKVKLEHRADIFVPLLNEAVILRDEQKKILRDHHGGLRFTLLESQVPKEVTESEE